MMFKVFWVHTGRYGLRLWKWIVYLLSSYWNNFWIKFGPGKIKNSIHLSKTSEFTFSKHAEILMFSIPEASGPRGSIRLIKLVSHLLARACNLQYGATIYQKRITKNNNIPNMHNQYKKTEKKQQLKKHKRTYIYIYIYISQKTGSAGCAERSIDGSVVVYFSSTTARRRQRQSTVSWCL